MSLKLRDSFFKNSTSQLAYLSIDAQNTSSLSDTSYSLHSPEKSAIDRLAESFKKLKELNNKEALLSSSNFNNWASTYQDSNLFNEEEPTLHGENNETRTTTTMKSAKTSTSAENSPQVYRENLILDESENSKSHKKTNTSREEPKSFLGDSLEMTNIPKLIINLQTTTLDLIDSTESERNHLTSETSESTAVSYAIEPGSSKLISVCSSSDQLNETYSQVIYDTTSPMLCPLTTDEDVATGQVSRQTSIKSLNNRKDFFNNSMLLGIQNEYKEFKIEPVKKMKQLYEVTGRIENVNSLDRIPIKKKSLETFESVIGKKWILTDKNKDKMKSYISHRPSYRTRISEEAMRDDQSVYNELKSTRIVNNLKQKFDVPCDQQVKKPTLQPNRPKIRQLLQQIAPSLNQSNNITEIASAKALEETLDSRPEKKSETLTTSSLMNTVGSEAIKQSGYADVSLVKLNSISSLSLESDPSYLTTSSLSSHCSATESSYMLSHRTSDLCSKLNNNDRQKQRLEPSTFTHNNKARLCKEIKNLLGIAENRTRLLCKVYDSSLNDESNTALSTNDSKMTKLNEKKQFVDLSKIVPKDYKGIIGQNYLKCKRKNTAVVAKVCLWDELLESGRIHSDKWNKEFIRNSIFLV